MGTLNIYSSNIIFSIITNLALIIIIMLAFYRLVYFLLPFATKPLIEKTISDVLPFKSIIEDKYLKLDKGSFASIIKLEGIDYNNLSGGITTNINKSRHNLFLNLSLKGAFIKIFISKSKKDYSISLNNSNNNLLNDIFTEVNKELENSFNLQYFIFCEAKSLKELEEATNKIISYLNELSPSLLIKNDITQFLWCLVNHSTFKELLYSHQNTNYLVSASRVSFDKQITIENNKNTFYASIFTLNTFSHQANSDFINKVTSLNMKLEIIINSCLYENNKAIVKLTSWEYLHTFLFSSAKSQQSAILKEGIMNNLEGLVNSQFSFIIYGSSIEELENNKKEFMNAVNSSGMNVLEEHKGTEISYFNRFIGFNYPIRERVISASNLASLIDFNTSNKSLTSCDWGPFPLAYFKNLDGSIYNFYLHATDNEGEAPSAHTVSFAPTGTGKTFLFQHIIAGALYFYNNVNVYCFDSNLGLKIFVESSGGSYLELKSGNVAINPLMLDLTDEENKNFLIYWFRIISMCEDDESLDSINNAVKLISSLPKNSRKLSVCLDKIFHIDTPINKALKKFATGIHKDLFNGNEDSMQLDTNRLFAFDMTNILKDEAVCPAFLSYVMFVIRKHAKNTSSPHIVFIDETSAMLQNKVFAKYIEVLLKEHRKLRGSINIVFQNVSDIANNETLIETILGQCKTRLIFKNPDAKSDIYTKYLSLNDNQIDLVRGISNDIKHLRRPLLIQKDSKVSIVDADLKYLGNLTKFYSSSINNINLLNCLKATQSNWYDVYKSE